MPAADYNAILDGIEATIAADVSGVAILQEEEVSYIEGSTVVIYFDRRRAPEEDQALAAGQDTRFQAVFTLWCLAVSYDGVRDASRLRNDLMGAVEVALMKDRTLNGSAISSWLEGGVNITGQNGDQSGFTGAGSITLIVDVRSTTL